MRLHYRIIAVDPDDCAITVRYSTDLLSERALSSEPGESKDCPDRCRSDYNLTLFDPVMSGEALHDHIVRSAPRDWLRLKEQALTDPPRVMAAARDLLGQTVSVTLTDDGEIDLTEALTSHNETGVNALSFEGKTGVDALSVDDKTGVNALSVIPVRLHKIRTRTDDGPGRFLLDFTVAEQDTILLPFQELIEEHPGFIRKETRRGDRAWRTIYECDSLASAKALHAKLNDPDNAVVSAMEELAARTAAREGVAFTVSFELTRGV